MLRFLFDLRAKITDYAINTSVSNLIWVVMNLKGFKNNPLPVYFLEIKINKF